MSTINGQYNSFQYGISGAAQMATHFYPIEKVSKISYRVIDLANMFIENPRAPFVLLSSQIKELVLAIESTRLFSVSFPLFFPNKKGLTFLQERPRLQCAERISLTCHLVLKTLFGADQAGLIRLGKIGTYALGNLPVFRWLTEGTIWLYNFFGAWDSTKLLMKTNNDLKNLQTKMNTSVSNTTCNENRSWNVIKKELQFNQTKALLKIAATICKLAVITLATTLAAFNISGTFSLATILSLAAFSDCFGLTSFYHQEFYSNA